jgi:hypothetical protein
LVQTAGAQHVPLGVPLRPPRRELRATTGLSDRQVPSVAAMVRLARGVPGVLVDHSQLDQRPELLNLLNGTVDLRTGRLLDHDPEHLLTMQAPAIYDPGATAPLREACLERWQPDPEMRHYLQRAIGSGATGSRACRSTAAGLAASRRNRWTHGPGLRPRKPCRPSTRRPTQAGPPARRSLPCE